MTHRETLVQLHLHTAETSACGHATGAEMAQACKRWGYDLLVVTDHFMNANIGCPRDWPWPDQVDYLFRGYEAARAEGERIGLTVLFGWETANGGPEYLTYGLGREFLLDYPDIARVDIPTYLDRVRAAGGFVIQAHPFRRESYIPVFTPDPTLVEAFEVWNSSHEDHSWDEAAWQMAREHNLIETAGCDAHTTPFVPGGAMRFPGEIRTNEELIAAIRSREGQIVKWIEGAPTPWDR